MTVSLPLIEAPVETQPAPRPRSHRARRVLLIDDNLDASSTLRRELELNGHDVKVAQDGMGGLELALEFVPEVVICDIGLPGMDGYAVAREFRLHAPLRTAFLVALTGYAQPEDVQSAREAGFNHHFAKPIDIDRLEEVFAGL